MYAPGVGHLQINHHAKTVKEAGAAVTLDGDRAFGQVAAHEAMALGLKSTSARYCRRGAT
ncbi:hypothetical protein ACNKHR_02790 [Shigella flexneri]